MQETGTPGFLKKLPSHATGRPFRSDTYRSPTVGPTHRHCHWASHSWGKTEYTQLSLFLFWPPASAQSFLIPHHHHLYGSFPSYITERSLFSMKSFYAVFSKPVSETYNNFITVYVIYSKWSQPMGLQSICRDMDFVVSNDSDCFFHSTT